MKPVEHTSYQQLLSGLKEKIRLARQKTIITVNYELLMVYWEIGNTILHQQQQEGWGKKVISRLAKDLKAEFPDMKGFSERNLVYMQTFAGAWPHFPMTQAPLAQLHGPEKEKITITQAPLAQITWYHHITLLDKIKEPLVRLFYLTKTIENGWSRNVMLRQVESQVHLRQGNAITNFELTLPKPQSDLARETLKNPYLFDFLGLGEDIQERELEKALIQHIKKFMLELGRGFAYVGNQYNLVVENDDYFLDLLFYNYHLHCFVVFELKIGGFKAEYAGKLNFYINTIDAQIKGKGHKPTIGILLCKTPNQTVVKYALQGIKTPIGIAEYELAQILPKELKGEIPTIAELEAEVDKGFEELKSPAAKRMDILKQKLATLNKNALQATVTYPLLCSIFDDSILPLFSKLLAILKDFEELFMSVSIEWQGTDQPVMHLDALVNYWKDETFLKDKTTLYFSYRLNGLKSAGVDSFNTGIQLNYHMSEYWYGFVLINYNNNEPFIKKPYHERPNEEDMQLIVEIIYQKLLEEIERRLEGIK